MAQRTGTRSREESRSHDTELEASGRPRADEPVSLLFYLFAERLVPPAALGADTALPGTDRLVASSDLARLLLAASFWNLREQG